MIRQARVEDLNEIVNVHRICFPNSLSTLLGEYYLNVIIWNIFRKILNYFLFLKIIQK